MEQCSLEKYGMDCKCMIPTCLIAVVLTFSHFGSYLAMYGIVALPIGFVIMSVVAQKRTAMAFLVAAAILGVLLWLVDFICGSYLSFPREANIVSDFIAKTGVFMVAVSGLLYLMHTFALEQYNLSPFAQKVLKMFALELGCLGMVVIAYNSYLYSTLGCPN